MNKYKDKDKDITIINLDNEDSMYEINFPIDYESKIINDKVYISNIFRKEPRIFEFEGYIYSNINHDICINITDKKFEINEKNIKWKIIMEEIIE